ncbi:MAG TPA: lipopolysaccharide kinase InaA family protein [Thermoanaerobaculia bacterium]|nr:lipopolysaccharide kinase InaA family protein [Thermoanaerobaculia bacterium]
MRRGRFASADLRGEVSESYPVALDELRRVIDPASADATVHWGRNYLYRTLLAQPGGPPLPVVVKSFHGDSARQRLQRRRKGSKAQRSFDASVALRAAGVPVPAPVAALETTAPRGASFFVCEHLEGALEARYLFRAMNAGRERELFPEVDTSLVLARLGRTLRRLHEAKLWHRDVSAGNVLLTGDWRSDGGGELYLVDLARTRIGTPLSASERMRDLARLPLHRARHREALLETYFGGPPPRSGRLLFTVHHHAFHRRHRVKDRLRGLRRVLASAVRSRGAHPHIPPARDGAPTRERVVWDSLSDQPHLHAGRVAKLYARAADAGVHGKEAAVLLRRLPAALARWRKLRRELYVRPVPFGEAGVGIHGGSAPGPELLSEVDGLGVRRVLLRLQPWEGELARDQALAVELRARGVEVVLAVAQNRELVRDRQRWRSALDEIGERFCGLAQQVQVGHAINRSKWGVWNQREYAELVAAAGELLGDARGMKILGPAVIDFELYATCIALNWPGNPVRFDAVTSLLYVDRRGAPENRQAGLDAVGKASLLRAIIQTSRDGDRPSWITEVNWPLEEGPHSPAGRHVAVSEDRQADYLARYYLLLLGSGLVERVYWWQLVARGYGLADRLDGGVRRRPAWHALAFLARELAGSRPLGPRPAPAPLRVHAFELADGSDALVAWSAADSVVAWKPPAPPRRLFDRDGRELPVPAHGEIRVGGSPIYAEMSVPEGRSDSSSSGGTVG